MGVLLLLAQHNVGEDANRRDVQLDSPWCEEAGAYQNSDCFGNEVAKITWWSFWSSADIVSEISYSICLV